MGIVDLLEQQTIGSSSPVRLETVFDHGDALRVHHRDARAIRPKDIPLIPAVVGIHEVHSVTQISLADVPDDTRVMRELEIDPVALAGDAILDDLYVARRPEVDAIAGTVLCAPHSAQLVVRDTTADRPGEINAEKGVLDVIILNPAMPNLPDADCRAVFDVARRDVTKGDSSNGDVVGLDPKDVRRECTVDDRPGLANDGQRPIDDDRRLA